MNLLNELQQQLLQLEALKNSLAMLYRNATNQNSKEAYALGVILDKINTQIYLLSEYIKAANGNIPTPQQAPAPNTPKPNYVRGKGDFYEVVQWILANRNVLVNDS